MDGRVNLSASSISAFEKSSASGCCTLLVALRAAAACSAAFLALAACSASLAACSVASCSLRSRSILNRSCS